MKIITQIDSYHPIKRPLVIAVGNFDGVHKGHQEIFRVVTERARAIGGEAAGLTFEEHPQHVIGAKDRPLLLTSFYQKLSLLAEAGIDLCFVLEFTEKFSKTSPEDFVREILIQKLGAKAVCMGFSARFGHGRLGDVRLMKQLARSFSIDFFEVGPVQMEGTPISSSLIRKLLREGSLDHTSRLLGRPYSLCGTVVRGRGKGSQIGYPTANLKLHSEALPPHGVYAVLVDRVQDEIVPDRTGGFVFNRRKVCKGLHGVLNHGYRPTFQGEVSSGAVVEVHVLDFHSDLLSQTLEVSFVKKLRDEKHFPSERSLCDQIGRDVSDARDLFAKFWGVSFNSEKQELMSFSGGKSWN